MSAASLGMRYLSMKYQVWVVTNGVYKCLIFERHEDAQLVIKNLKEYEDWNFTI